MDNTSLFALASVSQQARAGAFTGSELKEVEKLLASAWEELEGSCDRGMRDAKLHGRTENLEWQSAFLTLIIECNGGTVHGSKRAELQCWEVNMEL